MQATAQQVTGFARDSKGNVIYATSNPGKIFRLSPQRAAEGTYTSLVRDAQTVADWGTLSWRASVPAGSRVDVFTRSGNTNTPDDTWSAWSGTIRRGRTGEEITSPNARYLQWKAVLAGKQQPGPDVGLRRIRAAQPAAESDEPDGASVGHGVSKALSYRRSGHRGVRRPGARSPHSERHRQSGRRELGARPTRLPARSADVRLARRGRQRRRTAVRDFVPPGRRDRLEVAEERSRRRDLRVGHDIGAERHLRRQGDGVG